MRLTKHERAMVKAWGRAANYKSTLMDGSNPVERETLTKYYDVENEQRTECARRMSCLNHAAKMGWRAWSCEVCSVREMAVRDEIPTRVSSDESVAFPDVRM